MRKSLIQEQKQSQHAMDQQIIPKLYSMRINKKDTEPKQINSSSPGLTEVKKTTRIANFYVQQLIKVFARNQPNTHSIDSIINLLQKAGIMFLLDLHHKLTPTDFRNFVCSLTLMQRQCGTYVIQKGRKPQHQLILIQGLVSYNIRSDSEEEQMLKVGAGYPGFVIYPQVFMAPRFVNFTVNCQTDCTFLAMNEDVYNKYIKKLMLREVDNLASFLNQVPIFSGMGNLNIRKYSAYFIPRSYKFNETIYSAGNQADQIFVILEGQVQLFAKKNQANINIVNLSHRECFGLDDNQCQVRKFNAKCIDSALKVLVLNKRVLNIIKNENESVVENCSNYCKKIQKLRSFILNKNIKVLNQKQKSVVMAPKKKKRKMKKNKTSLVWWGLAQNVKIQHKYKMPSPPNSLKAGVSLSQDDKSPRSLMYYKINELKKKVMEEQIDDQDGLEDQQNQFNSPFKNNGNYAPKIKARIRVLEVRPKAIDMAEMVKKKLITYAKNMSSFCDRLNLQ